MEHVAAALAQRRHVDLHDVDAVEEILAEALLVDLVFEIAVRRGDDARVERDLACSTPTGRTLRSWSARRSFGCISSGSSPISSRKSVPPLGLDEEARALRLRVGERAARVAEELALEERSPGSPRS